jgi:hypothetical protein
MKQAGNNWNVNANIASSREYFPVAGNDIGKEFNNRRLYKVVPQAFPFPRPRFWQVI